MRSVPGFRPGKRTHTRRRTCNGETPRETGKRETCSQATGSSSGCESEAVLATASRENQQWSSGKIARIWQQMRAARRGKTAPGGPAIGDDGRRRGILVTGF